MHRQTVDQSGVRDFLKQTGQVGLSQIKTDHYGQLADLTFDGKPELILQSESQNFPHRIFGIGTVPFTDLTSLLPGTPITNDSLFADFDGDLRQDALVVSGKVRLNGGEIIAPNRIEAQIIADNAVSGASASRRPATSPSCSIGAREASVALSLEPTACIHRCHQPGNRSLSRCHRMTRTS